MKRSRLFGAVAVLVAVAVSLFGVAGTAAADPADDVAIMIDNLPAAADALAAGLQEAVDTLATTQSAVDTSAAIGEALVAAGSALVAGTEQFGALGLGFSLVNLVVQGNLAPYLGAIDDPSTAADLFNPDDLSTIAANLPAALEQAQAGLTSLVAEALKGNLVFGPGFGALGTPAVYGDLIVLAAAPVTLLENTNYSQAPALYGIPLIIIGVAAADYLQQAEDALAPLFDAAAPVTQPLIDALAGV